MLDRVVNFFLVHAAIVLPLVVILALMVSATARAATRASARILARLLLIGAVVALAYDVTRMLSGHPGLIMTSLAEHWAHISPATQEAAHKAVSSRIDPAVWDMVLAPLLGWPAWLTLGGLALLLGWLGRRRREIDVFVN